MTPDSPGQRNIDQIIHDLQTEVFEDMFKKPSPKPLPDELRKLLEDVREQIVTRAQPRSLDFLAEQPAEAEADGRQADAFLRRLRPAVKAMVRSAIDNRFADIGDRLSTLEQTTRELRRQHRKANHNLRERVRNLEETVSFMRQQKATAPKADEFTEERLSLLLKMAVANANEIAKLDTVVTNLIKADNECHSNLEQSIIQVGEYVGLTAHTETKLVNLEDGTES